MKYAFLVAQKTQVPDTSGKPTFLVGEVKVGPPKNREGRNRRLNGEISHR